MGLANTQSTCDLWGKTFWNSEMYICNPDHKEWNNTGCGSVMCGECLQRPYGDYLRGGKCFSCGKPNTYIVKVDEYLRRRA